MTEWKPAGPELTARLRDEMRTILGHLGDAGPKLSTMVEPRVDKDGNIRFLAGAEAYALNRSGAAVHYSLMPDGGENVSYWRDRKQVRRIYNPPPAGSN